MHYADMIANGYHRLAPCPFQTQGIMLNPDGGLFFCENSEVVGNVKDTDPEELYFSAASQAHRDYDPRREVPDVPEPVPDERRGDQAGRAVREVPRPRRASRSGVPHKAALVAAVAASLNALIAFLGSSRDLAVDG